jgi:hypothetical protein
VLDATLRSDLVVKQLLAHLDEKVGKDHYVLALTADHGVCPLPEVARAHGQDAGRFDPKPLLAGAQEFLRKTLGAKDDKTRWIESNSGFWLYLNRGLLKERGLESAVAEEALAGWLKQQPHVLTAYTRTQLARGLPAEDAIGQRVRKSFHPERCGDVALVLKPYRLASTGLTGTNHGTPHAYDTHVVLLAHVPGARGGVRQEAVTPQACAAILAHGLGIPPPASAEATMPTGLLR